MKDYRIDNKLLLDTISAWNRFLKRKVRLISCGGTALTLLGIKASTKDIDLIVPDLKEYEYLISILEQLGYKSVTGSGWTRGDGLVFDFFRGKFVHTTELLESPLKEKNHTLIKEFSYIYLGVLNYYDLIISKLFRGNGVDIEDCSSLIKAKQKDIDLKLLEQRFKETASYDISEDRVNKNLKHFLSTVKQKGLSNGR
ncbi:MAG: hypothetical protein P9L93_06335 [Candidatus Gorgyraea atricola]|nr:hypothetical protein [Candidatus Gorgyraea atricola]